MVKKKKVIIGILVIIVVIVVLVLLDKDKLVLLNKDQSEEQTITKQFITSGSSGTWSSKENKVNTNVELKDGWIRLWYNTRDFIGEISFINELPLKLSGDGIFIKAKGEGVWMVSLGASDSFSDPATLPYFMLEVKSEEDDYYLPFSDFGFRSEYTGDVSILNPDKIKSLIFIPSLGWSEKGQSHFLEIKEIKSYEKGISSETDNDGDGIPNNNDWDIDGDGWFNILEGYAGTDQMNPSDFPNGKLGVPSNGSYTGTLITSGATGIVEFEELTGMKSAIISVFPGWEINPNAPLKLDKPFLDWVWRHGSIPRHSWIPEGIRIQDILDGKHDEIVNALAREVKALKQPIIWAWGVEVTGSPGEPSNALWNFGKDGTEKWFETDNMYTYYGDPNKPDGIERWKDYVAYMKKVFDSHGANNLIYFFHVLAEEYSTAGEDILDGMYPVPGDWNSVEKYYPSDEFVDWCGLSVNGPMWHKDKWRTLDEIFSDNKNHLTKLQNVCKEKPFFIPEFSFFPQENKNPEKSRAELFSKVFEQLKTKYPFIKAWTYENTRALSPPVLDIWPIAPFMGPDSPPDEIEAFKKAVTENSYFIKDPILLPK